MTRPGNRRERIASKPQHTQRDPRICYCVSGTTEDRAACATLCRRAVDNLLRRIGGMKA
jgi:hypothetical protein